MAAGVAFDPAEFAAFKSGLAAPTQDAAPAPPGADAFDPAEFQAFKVSRQGSVQRPTRAVPNPMDTVGQASSFSDRFGAGPMASTLDTSTREGAALRRTADEALIGKPSAENQADAGLFRFANAMGLNVPRNMMAGAEALRSGKSFGDSYRYVQDVEDALARQNPKTALGGTIGGAVAGAVTLPAWSGATSAIGRIGQAAVTGASYGAAAEAIDKKTLGDAAAGAGLGAAAGLIGGGFLEGAGKAYAAVRRAGVPFRSADGILTDQASAALREAGIDPATITPELAQHLDTTFAVKGPSVAAAREAQAAEFGLPLSRGQATQDPQVLALEGRALAGQSGPRAQQIGEDFAGRQADAVSGVRDRFLGMAAGDAPRIETPQVAYEAVADRARQAVQAEAERASVAQRGLDDALRGARGRGETDALDAATLAAQGVRDAAQQGRTAYRGAYDDVAQIPGTFAPGALDRLGSRVRDRLGADVPIDPVLTPAATRAIGDLDALPGLFNLQPGEGPSLQQLDQVRKRLVAYRGTTGQNPTDRRAVDRIIAEFDTHAQDAMSVGLFGQQAPARAADLAGDGFPGFPATVTAPEAASAAGGASAGKSEPLTHYLARNGGIALDGDARAADLGRVMTPYGPLGRRAGRPIEDFRDQLASEGFLRPDSADGMISRRIGNEVHDLIGLERSGQPVYRLADLSRGGAPADVGGRLADQSTAYAERVAPFRQQVVDDLASVGVRPRDMDPAHIDDAAQRLFRGEHDTGADAYEAAVLGRQIGSNGRSSASVSDTVPFDSPTAAPTSDALPIGDTAPLEAMQRARGLFRQYQTTFKPHGPGDTAGTNLRRIVERDASPNEVAAMLFGTTTGRISPGQVQTLSRLRDAVGVDSEPWAAVQRGLIARHLGGEGQDLGRRLDYLLRGEGRTLTAYLSQEQRAGLGQLRAAVQQAENAGRPTPTWATDLERTGFDPNAVGRSLFGSSGAIGAKPGAASEARAARAFLGADSHEWAGLRQAVVQRLLDPAMPATKMVAGLRDFTEGAGKGVANTLFNAEELAHFRRLAGALQATVRPDGTIKPGAAGEAGRKAVAKAMDVIAGAIAFKVGGLGAAAGTYGAKVGTRAVMGGVGAASARRSFKGGAPRLLAPAPMLPLGQVSVGTGLYAGQQ